MGQACAKNLEGENNKNKKEERGKEIGEEVDENLEKSDEAEMILELEVENLQKNNESEFFLDEDFYERMANEFNKKQNPETVELNDIEITDKESISKTEDPDNCLPEDDEGMNPLAQTHEGKGLLKMLQRDSIEMGAERSNLRSGNKSSEDLQEEEKRIAVSLSHENLEITINQNAPPNFTRKTNLGRSKTKRILLEMDDEESINDQR